MNPRFIAIMSAYLAIALVAQLGVIPALQNNLPGWGGALIAAPLVALAPILAGLLRGELAGIATGLAAALLLGLGGQPEWLGPGAASFAAGGFAAGWLARYSRFTWPVMRWGIVMLLLSAESLAFSLVRRFFWTEVPIDLPWLGLAAASLLGSVVYGVLARAFRRNVIEED